MALGSKGLLDSSEATPTYTLSTNVFSLSRALNPTVNHTEKKRNLRAQSSSASPPPPSSLFIFPPGVHHTKSCSVKLTVPGIITQQRLHNEPLCADGVGFDVFKEV